MQSIARAGIVPTDSESAADRQSNPHRWWRSYWRRVKVLASQRWQPILVFSAAMFVFNALRIQSVIPVDDPLFSVAAYTLADMPGMPLLIFTALVLSEALGFCFFAGVVGRTEVKERGGRVTKNPWETGRKR